MLPALRQRMTLPTRVRFGKFHYQTKRFTSSSIQPIAWWKRASLKDRRIMCAAAGGTSLVVGVFWMKPGEKHHQSDVQNEKDLEALSNIPLDKLISGWIAYTFCSSPRWVDKSETLYKVVSRVPIVSSMAHSFVMKTFFRQFLGGETVEECVPIIRALRKDRVGTLLGYNIEARLDGTSKDPQLISAQKQLVLESIETQGKLAKEFSSDAGTSSGDNRSWVRIKLTGLLPHPAALQHASAAILRARAEKGLDEEVPYPGLPHDGDWEAALNGRCVTAADREQLLDLRATLEVVAAKARSHNVRVVIDAEQSWYQPVIDCLTDELMQRYNRSDGPATCMASFQAYLRRYPQLLEHQLRRADEKGYKLLFKQVRGAYMASEAERWREEKREGQGPVWSTKAETDASFNFGVEKAIAIIADGMGKTGRSKIGVLLGTHNSHSVDLGMRLLEQHGLAHRRSGDGKLVVPKGAADSIAFGQVYGMKDDLSNRITGSFAYESEIPLVVKSMSYGDLKECLPFLARRATENKSVLEGRGGAASERIRLGREICRRFLPFW